MAFEQLKLDNQLCFPVYAASRLIIREYQPLLDKLGITYPQYLVLLVLWEQDSITVNEIAHKLILNTNTITPLLKRMESQGIVTRNREGSDERKVIVRLTEKGRQMQTEAVKIPEQLGAEIASEAMNVKELLDLKEKLYTIISYLNKKERKDPGMEL
jgi:DNA-binding MarR family transcriptional regulator